MASRAISFIAMTLSINAKTLGNWVMLANVINFVDILSDATDLRVSL